MIVNKLDKMKYKKNKIKTELFKFIYFKINLKVNLMDKLCYELERKIRYKLTFSEFKKLVLINKSFNLIYDKYLWKTIYRKPPLKILKTKGKFIELITEYENTASETNYIIEHNINTSVSGYFEL